MISSIFLCSKFFPVKNISINSTHPSLCFQKNQSFLLNQTSSNSCTNRRSYTSSCISQSYGLTLESAISSEISSNRDSYTASYLINSCGLSPETAILASGKVSFETTEKPDAVLSLLRNNGFSETQIANLVRKRPSLLLSSPQNTLLPKLEFFHSIGFTNTGIARAVSKDPTLLTRSLKNQILPNYNFLRSVLKSNEKVVAATRRTTWIFLEDYTKNLEPNIVFLRGVGLPESCVILLLTHFPEAVMLKHDQFKETVAKVKGMGFDPMKSQFVLAVHVFSGEGNKSIWDRCCEVYKNWGWSEDDILMAFRKQPNCMILSEKKITRAMDFLVNKMGWPSRLIASCPAVLLFSLEKRIIPRCYVIQALSVNGLIKKDVSLLTVMIPAEKYFLERFVTKYEEELPQLWGVYQGEVHVSEL